MSEIYHLVISVAYGVWRKRFYALVIAWVLSLVGWALIAQIPNTYESTARIHVDADSILRPLLKDLTISNNVFNQLRVMRQTLTSRRNIEKVLRKTDLDLTYQSDEEEDKLIELITKNVKIQVEGQNLFRITYFHTNPIIARKIVKALIDIFQEQDINSQRTQNHNAIRFIEDKITEYEDEQNRAEGRLIGFKQENLEYISGSRKFIEKLGQAESIEKRSRQMVKRLLFKKERIEEQLKTYLLSNSGPATASASALTLRLDRMQLTLDEYYERGLKDGYPDVKRLLSRIKILEEKVAIENAEYKKQITAGKISTKAGSQRDPIYVNMKKNLDDLVGEIAISQAQLTESGEMLNSLRLKSGRVPEVEAELRRLQRNFTVAKRKFEAFTGKQDKAQISMDLANSDDRVIFKVIDPPQIAREPSGPLRLLSIIAVLIAGLGTGVVVAYFLSQLHTTFSSEAKLRETYNLPVLGSISVISTDIDNAKRKKSLAIFIFFLVALFLTAALSYTGMTIYHDPSKTI